MEQQHYDVFISFKNTNSDGTPSIDCQFAAEAYKILTERGISAFYSNIKLLELGEATYKKAIEDALDQSSVLLCILSCKDFATSKWVEYERESFHEDILSGRNPGGVIVPYLGGELKGNDIPRSIRNYESFSMEAHTVAEVCDFISNILSKRRSVKTHSPSGTSLTTGKTNSVYSPEYGREVRRLKIQARETHNADMPAIRYCLERLPETDRICILDAGCAYGYVTHDRFADLPNSFVLGVDRSENCLERAREKFSAPNIAYERLDLEGEDFEDELEDLMDKHDIPQFDIIFSSLVIHHLHNPQKFLRRLRRYLKEDGFIIIRGSDDGSIMTYNDGGLIEKIIDLHLSTDGISDRKNGRKIYHQLISSGYKHVKMMSYIKDLSGLNLDRRYEFYLERYDYRKNYLKIIADKDPYNMEKRNNYEYMKLLLEELENKFADKTFWCSEVDFVGIAQKDDI